MLQQKAKIFLRASGVLSRRGECYNRRMLGFWWGHETVEDRERARRRKQEMKIIHWQSPHESPSDVATSSAVEPTATYTPLRVEKEESALNVGYDMSRMTISDYYGWVNHPRSFVAFCKYPHIYNADKRINGYKKLVRLQAFNRERLLALGPDLSAAHFLLSRGCSVKLRKRDEWLTTKVECWRLPKSYEPGWYVEAIDASNSNLIYEGIQNIRNLIHLKSLNVSYSPFIDSFCMDRITGEFRDSLEELDLSGCKELQGINSLEPLWRLRKLKILTLRDMDHIRDLRLLCLMLLEELPDLEIRGVDYANPKLLEESEHKYLLEEYEQLLLEPGNVIETTRSDVNQEISDDIRNENKIAVSAVSSS